jgi:hypothetical protein
MEHFGLSPLNLLQHDDRFCGNTEVSAMLEAVLRKRKYVIPDDLSNSTVDDVLFSVLGEQNKKREPGSSHLDVEEKNKTRDEFDKLESTDSSNVKLMADTLKKLVSSVSTDGKMSMYEKQSWLEEECKKLSLDQYHMSYDTIPDSIKGMHSVSNQAVNEWVQALADQIEFEVGFSRNLSKDGNDDVSGSNLTASEREYMVHLATLKPKNIALVTVVEFLKIPSRYLNVF